MMTMTMKKPCLDCGIPSPQSRCASCSEKRLIANPPRFRGTTTQRGYGAEWQRVRRLILDRDRWICYLCNKKLSGSDATVDHIIPLSINKDLGLDPSNLAACCRSCNSKKSGK